MKNVYDSNFLNENAEKIEKVITGKTVKEANEILIGTGYFVYPISMNGLPCIITADLNFSRVQSVVEDGVITKVIGIG